MLVLPAMGKNTTDGMPLRKIVVRLSIDLPPAAASDILGGIRQQLDEKLLRCGINPRYETEEGERRAAREGGERSRRVEGEERTDAKIGQDR